MALTMDEFKKLYYDFDKRCDILPHDDGQIAGDFKLHVISGAEENLEKFLAGAEGWYSDYLSDKKDSRKIKPSFSEFKLFNDPAYLCINPLIMPILYGGRNESGLIRKLEESVINGLRLGFKDPSADCGFRSLGEEYRKSISAELMKLPGVDFTYALSNKAANIEETYFMELFIGENCAKMIIDAAVLK